MRLRFPRAVRLQRSSEFALLKREGSSFHGKYMVLSVLRSAPVATTRIGIITSRRVGGAVVRTKVRRRIRELVRATRPQLMPNLWLVIVARPHASRADFSQFQKEWLELAARANILQAPAPSCAS
jgi:ribonuclease P protein component